MTKDDLVIFRDHMVEEFRYWVTGFHHSEHGMIVQRVSTSPVVGSFIDAEERDKGRFCVPSDYNPLGRGRWKAKPYPEMTEEIL